MRLSRSAALLFSASASFALHGAALADARDEARGRIARCDAVADDRAWLACVDAAVAPLRGALAVPPPPAPPPARPQPAPMTSAPPASKSAAKPSMTERFGMLLPKAPAEPTPQISSPMTAYSFDRFGMFTVTLANGQVWRQIPADTSIAHWGRRASSYTVRIRQGALNSFNLSVEREGGSYKVLRVQ